MKRFFDFIAAFIYTQFTCSDLKKDPHFIHESIFSDFANEKFQRALKKIEKLLNRTDLDPETRITLLGTKIGYLSSTEQYKDALDNCEECLKIPEISLECRCETLLGKAAIYEKIGKHQEALQICEELQAATDLPAHLKNSITRCRCAIKKQMGDIAGAIEIISQIRNSTTEDSQEKFWATSFLKSILIETKDTKEAIKIVTELIEDKELDRETIAENYHDRGYLYLTEESYRLAENDFSKALKLTTSLMLRESCYSHRSNAREQLENFKGAMLDSVHFSLCGNWKNKLKENAQGIIITIALIVWIAMTLLNKK